MSITASGMMLRGLHMIGDKASTITALTAADEALWLPVLQAMLDAWNIERLMCYQIIEENFALTASTGSYTIGSGGTFNTARPTKIIDPCFVRDSSGVDYPVQIIDARAYGLISQKTTDGTNPQYLFYDLAFVTGLGTIFLYPEPAASLTLYINSWKKLQEFSSATTQIMLPPGYQEAIESNFAVRAALGYVPVPDDVRRLAITSKAAIKAINMPEGILRLDPGLVGTGRSNIFTG